MARLGHYSTRKTWASLLNELRTELTRWAKKDVLFPTYDESLKARTVTVQIARNGEWVEVRCARFPTPEQNLGAIVQAVAQFRKDEVRGISGLYEQIAKLASLPSGPSRNPSSPYSVLGVAEGASQEECRAAFRKLAQLKHPDHGGTTKEWLPIRDAAEKLGVLG